MFAKTIAAAIVALGVSVTPPDDPGILMDAETDRPLYSDDWLRPGPAWDAGPRMPIIDPTRRPKFKGDLIVCGPGDTPGVSCNCFGGDEDVCNVVPMCTTDEDCAEMWGLDL